MITVHHLEQSRSHRVLWLLEELELPESELPEPELPELEPDSPELGLARESVR